jgi:hypothetical protein
MQMSISAKEAALRSCRTLDPMLRESILHEGQSLGNGS